MKAWLKVVAVVIVLVATGVVAVSLAPVPLEGDVSVDPRNEQVYAALAANNIEDAAVDVTDERVLVSLAAPDGIDAAQIRYIVFGAASQIDPVPPLIIVEVFDQKGNLMEASQIQTVAVLRYMANEISFQELEGSVQRLL